MRLTERGPLPPGRSDDELLELVHRRAEDIRNRRRLLVGSVAVVIVAIASVPVLKTMGDTRNSVTVAADQGQRGTNRGGTSLELPPGKVPESPSTRPGDVYRTPPSTFSALLPPQSQPTGSPHTTQPQPPQVTGPSPTTQPTYPSPTQLLYWVIRNNGDNLYTTGLAEYDRERNVPGAVDKGAVARLFEPGTSGTVPLKRYYNPSGYHFYCAGPTCDGQATAAGYASDGAGPGNVSTSQIPGTVALYRFSSLDGTLHLYSTSLAQSSDWHYDGGQEGWVGAP